MRKLYFRKLVFSLIGTLFMLGATAFASPRFTLENAIQEALEKNPELAAAKDGSSAEHKLVRSQYSPKNPRIGFMREKNMNLMEQEMGPMNSWSISQELDFPVKYLLMGSMQKSRAEGSSRQAEEKQLQVRSKVISNYYALFVSERIIDLFQAQKETLRGISRIAESRYATGAVAQQDQMKAHVEQAKIENELLMAEQERDTMNAQLSAVLNRESLEPIELPADRLPIPELNATAAASITRVASTSKKIQASEFAVKESSTNKSLAAWNYAPDIMLSYRKPFSASPSDAYAFSVELSIPFWFFLRQTSEYSAASAKAREAESNHEMVLRETAAEATALLSKTKANARLLKIYETSLIPLATNTLNTSQGLYRAGKSSFIELLDSERALYETRIAYYRTLTQYVDALVKLEEITGVSLSSLPKEGIL